MIEREHVFRSAGVSPAISPVSAQGKNAGETPALRKPAKS
jgi:hypothetical protein